jgi:TonB family protein
VGSVRQDDSQHFYFGLFSSLALHVVLVVAVLLFGQGPKSDFGKAIVYSVTIERGDRIGGIAQVPREEKAQLAPPKQVSGTVKQPEVKQPEATKSKQPTTSETQLEVSDAEVSLAKREEKKPPPQKTPPQKPKQEAPKKAPPAKKPPAAKTPSKQASKAQTPNVATIDERLSKAVQRYAGASTDAGGEGFGSAGGGGKGFGGGVLRPPEFFAYQTTLEYFIKSGWRWHDQSSPLMARVCFRISPEGRISQVQLCGSSGNSLYDTSIIRAVQKADPVPAPPASVYHFFQEVRMTFTPGEF